VIEELLTQGKGLLDQAKGYAQQAADQYRDATAYPQPICRVVVNGQDITSAIEQRLISIELTDNRGMEADQLSISLSDHDGLLAIPPRGAVVRLWLGWHDTGLVDKGSYTVDEVEHSGAPDVLNIRARSADLREGLKAKKERSWSGQTLGAIVQTVAGAYGLSPVISAALSVIQLAQVDQANESDANLLSRLGQQFDAIASIKAGRLLFMPAGKSVTASGAALPHITLTRADGDNHRYLKDLRHTYTDQEAALRAARAEWSRLQRGTATLSYTLAKGRPELTPDQTYSLLGIKAEISAIVWLGGNLRHSFTPDSYTTSLELESKLPDGDDVDLLADHDGDYTGVVAWYREEKTGEQKKLTAGDQTSPKRLLHLYAEKSSAQRAVEREWKRLQEAQKAP
jgi:hypothetical protein